MDYCKKLSRKRTPLRVEFSKIANSIEEELKKDVSSDLDHLGALIRILSDRHDRLEEAEAEILSLLLDDEEKSDEDYAIEVAAANQYRDRYLTLKFKVDSFCAPKVPRSEGGSPTPSDVPSLGRNKRKFKLPRLELKKFNGDVKEWLGFWGQFQKIHDDEEIAPEDKFQYLSQSMVPGSRAASLLESYPPTAANYPKVVEQLKNRFARDDLLVQVYVRELLSMVMSNAIAGRVRGDLSSLYDRLESHLRALESLGRTQDKFADFLAPLVESCLPEDLLMTWERHRNSEDSEKDSAHLLDKLMKFLRREVNGEEMFKLAKIGFGCRKEAEKVTKKKTDNVAELPTAAALFSSSDKHSSSNATCVFCGKGHNSSACNVAGRMTMGEKKKQLRTKNCCFICFKVGHDSRKCRVNVRCQLCDKKHHAFMCPMLQSNSEEVVAGSEKITKEEMPSMGSTALTTQSHQTEVLLQTLQVKVSCRGKELTAVALIDTGSQRSYVHSAIVRKLKLNPVRREKMSHCLFGNLETPPQDHAVFNIQLKDMKDSYSCHFDTLEQNGICGKVPILQDSEYLRLLQEAGITLPKYSGHSSEVDLLIGADVAGKLMTGKIKSIGKDLTAIETRLGWTVMGKVGGARSIDGSAMTVISLYTSQASVANLWKLDVLGIVDPHETKTKDDRIKQAMTQFQETVTTLHDGRYQVGLPWREDHSPLPSNKELAWKRHCSTISKLKKEGKLESYEKVFEEWKKIGIIEEVPVSELDIPGHYLPHRPVIKEESATTKVRPVFDASAHLRGEPSLNDCLEKGANFIELIPDILDRFRIDRIGVTADVEKAFLQLEVKPSERDYLRFFSPSDGRILRHRRVVFGVSSSPFLLGAVLDYHFSKMSVEFPSTAEKLKLSFYVDNCVASVSSKEELQKFVSDSRNLMQQACLNLRDWVSNESCEDVKKPSGEVSLLGLLWNVEQDTLRCNISRLLGEECQPVTKRNILSITQRIFDPIGFTCPATVFPKRILQDVWLLKVGWDEPLPETFCKRFEDWRRELPLLQQIEIPRYSGGQSHVQFHVFVDASQEAYATCIYLRSIDAGKVKVTLLRAKSRISPSKGSTIPRLELLACCIGARLASNVIKALGLRDVTTYFWSDSTTALWWIQHEGPWTVFVQNRVNEIRQLTRVSDWRHIPGILNPADLPSRGCSISKLLLSKWWEGPDWLLRDPEEWPQSNQLELSDEVNNEKKKSVLDNLDLNSSSSDCYLERFSSYHRVLRLVAWIKRFIHNARIQVNQRKTEVQTGRRRSGELTLEEIEDGEATLFRVVQDQHLKNKNLDIRKNEVTDHQGLRRIETRITEREDSENFKYPILLPASHPLVHRLIEYHHRESCHAGSQILMGILREKYWIIGARKIIRKIIRQCGRCQRFYSKPLTVKTPALPLDRVRDAFVFEVTGVDLAGPVFLKGSEKAWIVLFTCAVYRAIHLELVTSLSTDAFLLSLKRFIARRGRPRVIYSDNGTNFRGADRAFGELNWDVIVQEADLQRISWKFNPPASPWWGGWWERIVQTVKNLMKRMLGRATLNYEELVTALCDCEAVVNSRPLTYLSEDSEDMIPLTPATFLQDLKGTGVADIDKIQVSTLVKRARYRQKISSDLRERFRKEYLSQLVGPSKSKSEDKTVKVGDVVLVGDDSTKRIDWPIGRIIEVLPGKDGKIRVARISVRKKIVLRAVQVLYPLEMGDVNFSVLPNSDAEVEENERSNKTGDHATRHHVTRNSEVDNRRTGNSGEVVDPEALPELSEAVTRSGRRVKLPQRLDLFSAVIV